MIRLAIAFAAVAGLAGAAGQWVRLESDRFEIYSSAGERPARRVLETLRRGQSVMGGFAGGAPGTPLPVRVYVFGSEAEIRLFRPSAIATGFYQGGPVRDIIALHYRDENSLRTSLHEFIHLVLSHSTAGLPRWLEEGTAEFYSTLRLVDGRARVGGVIPPHLAVLDSAAWMDAAALAAVTPDSPEYQSRGRANLFYAQSWALVHMLNAAPAYRERMPRFIELLADGRPAKAAFGEAFGRPMERAIEDLRTYVRERRFSVAEVDAAAALSPTPPRAYSVSPAEAEYALAELACRTGRLAEAEKSYRRLVREPQLTAEAEGKLGILALRMNRDSEALSHFSRAIHQGSRDAETHFEYAMLRREKGAPRREVADSLSRAVALSPDYAEAHFLLGLTASEEHRTTEAVGHLKRAARILPRQSQFWHALAVAAHEAGDAVEARRAARLALTTAADPREVEMAEAAIRLVNAPPSPPRARRPAETTPPSWENPKGDRRVEGTLTRIDCLGQSARFIVTAGGRDMALYVARPGEVLLKNVSSVTFEFRCGPQKPRTVAVEYLAKPDPRLSTEGEVTSIEFH